MSPDRKIMPAITPVSHIDFLVPEKKILDNGSEVYLLKGGDQEIVKLDFIFRAGNWYEKHKLTSVMCASMLREGTLHHSAVEIAKMFDFYGAQFSSSPHYDNNYVALLSLKKYLPKLLPLLSEIFQHANFPEKEFEVVRQKRKQQAFEDAQRVGLMAQRSFLRTLLGHNHPYSPVKSPLAYDVVQRNQTIAHYQEFYTCSTQSVIASGLVDDHVVEMLNNHFGTQKCDPKTEATKSFAQAAHAPKQLFVPKKEASQNAICIGRLIPTQKHPDHAGLRVLTALLGGYFGSRLMMNLREDKGYTYNVQASPISFLHEGVLLIYAEVAASKSKEASKEIYNELNRLCSELISEEELAPLRNYMMGQLLQEFDGPFAQAQSFASVHEFGMDYSSFEQLRQTILTITPIKLMELAQTYFNPETMTEVIAGA